MYKPSSNGWRTVAAAAKLLWVRAVGDMRPRSCVACVGDQPRAMVVCHFAFGVVSFFLCAAVNPSQDQRQPCIA